jgi:peptidoglycan/LPS O-acetylase OafA/YrhL
MEKDKRVQIGHIPGLNGLRGIAVIGVMLCHAQLRFFKGGYLGVDIFFVLSGFLITSLLLKEYDANGTINLRLFYMRRVLRLGPALLTLLIVLMPISLVVLNGTKARYHLVDTMITLCYVANWARAFRIHPPFLLAHAWSLSIEEQFYILWPPLLLLLLRRVSSRWKVLSGVLILAVVVCSVRIWMTHSGVRLDRMSNGLDTRADSLLTGCALGLLLFGRTLPAEAVGKVFRCMPLASVCAACGLAAVALVADPGGRFMFYWGMVCVELLSAVLICAVVASRDVLVARILSYRPLVAVGTISYGLYLWHFPVYMIIHYSGYSRKAEFFVGTIVTFICASASYFWIETPALRLKDRLRPGRSGTMLRPRARLGHRRSMMGSSDTDFQESARSTPVSSGVQRHSG